MSFQLEFDDLNVNAANSQLLFDSVCLGHERPSLQLDGINGNILLKDLLTIV